MTHRLLLDTASLAYRAFFALPSTIIDADGRPVNAVRGYVDMVAHLLRTHAPDEVVHCLDHDWRPAPRVAAYDGYKSTRLPDPEALPWQFTLLDQVLEAAGMLRAHAEGWEADDVIGTYATAVGAGDRADIVTGDRDLLQLVRDPAVRVLFTVRGVKDLAVFDEAAVQAKYGVPADRYVDFAILRGDPSDGLPGVRGVGEKTARDLIRAHGSLDGLLAAAADLTPALRGKLTDAAAYLVAMRDVVPVRTDIAIVERREPRDDAALDRLAAAHALGGSVDRLREALGA